MRGNRVNLLQETLVFLLHYGYTLQDLIFLGSEQTGHSCTWEEFCILADIKYDKGQSPQEIACDLIIVFADGAIVRRIEYDGAEKWKLTRPFVMSAEKKPISKLISEEGWQTLEEING